MAFGAVFLCRSKNDIPLCRWLNQRKNAIKEYQTFEICIFAVADFSE